MANSSLNLVGLDFDSIKGNLRTFLKTQTAFKDYDFEGSSTSHLIDLLAYNTYINSFYLNMVGKEMFLDTAQDRDSVVSHAKELNYIPRSYISATASIGLTITSSANVVVIPKYTSFTTRVGAGTFSFTTDEHVVLNNGNNGVFTANVDVFEGAVVSDTFIVDTANAEQRFVLSNPTLDTGSIAVTVIENGTTEREFLFADTLHGVSSNSAVFFIQPAENSQYEIQFGRNNFGVRPINGAAVVATYRATSGELPNGASVFVSDGPIDGSSNVKVTTLQPAYGGAVQESIESIRQNAPKAFAAQGRAVTAEDYKTLLQTAFPEIQSINVFGGEEADPPQYGRVFVCIDLFNMNGVSGRAKEKYRNFLAQRTPLSIDVDFIDPEFTYVELVGTVKYDVTSTKKTASEIRAVVLASIESFNTTQIDGFNKTLRYSKLMRAIDDSDPSIVGNTLDTRAFRIIEPIVGSPFSTTVKYKFPLATETGISLTSGAEVHYGHTITSTSFMTRGRRAMLVDDTKGTLHVATFEEGTDASTFRIAYPVGAVDYESGTVTIDSLNVDSFDGVGIKLFVKPKQLDIAGTQNIVLSISLADSNIAVEGAVV